MLPPSQTVPEAGFITICPRATFEMKRVNKSKSNPLGKSLGFPHRRSRGTLFRWTAIKTNTRCPLYSNQYLDYNMSH